MVSIELLSSFSSKCLLIWMSSSTITYSWGVGDIGVDGEFGVIKIVGIVGVEGVVDSADRGVKRILTSVL